VIFSEQTTKPLLAESFLALLGSNVAVVDRADSRRGRALVQVLHELVQRALLALSLASDL
jgi:RNase P/RNase MRP subunit POP5